MQNSVNVQMDQIHKVHGIISGAENALQVNADSLAEVRAYCEVVDTIITSSLSEAQAASKAVQEISELIS